MKKSIHSPRNDTLRKGLVAARKEAGLTQAQVAAKIGRPQSFVAKYEGGERRIDVIEYLTLAEVIGFDPVELLRAL